MENIGRGISHNGTGIEEASGGVAGTSMVIKCSTLLPMGTSDWILPGAHSREIPWLVGKKNYISPERKGR